MAVQDVGKEAYQEETVDKSNNPQMNRVPGREIGL